MIRQAQTYLTGAMSSMALIAAAIVAFVLLVSLQAVKDWPFAGLVGGDSGSSSTTVAGHPPRVAGAAGPTPTLAPAPGAPAPGAGAGPRGGAVPGGGEGGGAPATVDTGRPPAGGPAPGAGPSPADTSSPPASGGGGGAGGSGSGPLGSSPSKTATGTVNEVVSGVDHSTGGSIDASGVGKTVEGTVEEVAGPESTVGSTVEKAGKSVGGLLGQGE